MYSMRNVGNARTAGVRYTIYFMALKINQQRFPILENISYEQLIPIFSLATYN